MENMGDLFPVIIKQDTNKILKFSSVTFSLQCCFKYHKRKTSFNDVYKRVEMY